MTLYVFLSVVVFLLYIQAGIFVFLQKPVLKVNRLFAYMLFALAWTSLFFIILQFANNPDEVYLIDRIGMFGWLAFPLFTVLFFVQTANLLEKKPMRNLVFLLGMLAMALMIRYIWEPQSLKVFYQGASGMWYFESTIESLWVIAALLYNFGAITLGLVIVWNYFISKKNSHLNRERVQSRIFVFAFLLFLIIATLTHIVFPIMSVPALPGMIHLAALPLIGAIFATTTMLHPQIYFKEMVSKIFIRRIKEFVFYMDHNGLIYSMNQYCLEVLKYNQSDMVNKDPGRFIKPSRLIHQKMEDVLMNIKTEDLVCLMITREGQAIPVSVSVTRVYDAFRNMIGFLLIASDYRHTKALHKERNNRKHAEQKLIAQNLKLEQMVNERSSELIEIQKTLHAEHLLQQEAEKQVLTELKIKEEMLRELHHRVKNNIQMIISLINMEEGIQISNRAPDLDYGGISDRIRTISMIHEFLYNAPYLGEINLKHFVDKIIGELRVVYPLKSFVRFYVSFENSVLSISQAIPCGIIIFELLSNSLKHAFENKNQSQSQPDDKAHISLMYETKNNRSVISVYDNGDTPISLRDGSPVAKKTGLTLVELMVYDYLQGSIVYLNQKGTAVQIGFGSIQKQGQ